MTLCGLLLFEIDKKQKLTQFYYIQNYHNLSQSVGAASRFAHGEAFEHKNFLKAFLLFLDWNSIKKYHFHFIVVLCWLSQRAHPFFLPPPPYYALDEASDVAGCLQPLLFIIIIITLAFWYGRQSRRQRTSRRSIWGRNFLDDLLFFGIDDTADLGLLRSRSTRRLHNDKCAAVVEGVVYLPKDERLSVHCLDEGLPQ